jgi:hypothetical protein
MLIANLIFMYHVIIASERLLREAIDETRDNPPLRAYLERHLVEEHGHAQWLAEDLQCVNIDVHSTCAPLLAVQMAGSLYYLIFHAHPAALLGYMAVLESWPMDKARFAELGRPYPPQLLRTLNHHIDHDPEHWKDLQEMIELVPEHRALIEQVASMTRNYLLEAARSINKHSLAA